MKIKFLIVCEHCRPKDGGKKQFYAESPNETNAKRKTSRQMPSDAPEHLAAGTLAGVTEGTMGTMEHALSTCEYCDEFNFSGLQNIVDDGVRLPEEDAHTT